MKPCFAANELDRYAFEELSPLTAAQVALHVHDCGRCALELSWLRAEREALFRRSQALDTLPARSLYRQLASKIPALAPARQPSWAGRAFLFTAVCFAWMLLMPARTVPEWGFALGSTMTALSPPGCLLACVDPAAEVEATMSACLVATPAEAAGGLNSCR